MKELSIFADGLSLHLDASQLFGAAQAVQLRGAGTVQLHLPMPGHSRPWNQQVQRVRQAGGMAANPHLAGQLCDFALLEAFRPAAGLQTAQLCAHSWALQLPALVGGSAPPAAVAAAGGQPPAVMVLSSSDIMLDALSMAFEEALGQFGRLRTTDSKLVNGQLQLSLRRSRVGAAAIRTCGLLGRTLANLACASHVTCAVLAWLTNLAPLTGHINLPRVRTVCAAYALSTLSLCLTDHDFGKLLLRHT